MVLTAGTGSPTPWPRSSAQAPDTLTINVEYNQLDPLLRATVNKDGDVNDASGEHVPCSC